MGFYSLARLSGARVGKAVSHGSLAGAGEVDAFAHEESDPAGGEEQRRAGLAGAGAGGVRERRLVARVVAAERPGGTCLDWSCWIIRGTCSPPVGFGASMWRKNSC